ncbi:MAG: hypothetical protein AB1609_17635 [Bacillota bacterium]
MGAVDIPGALSWLAFRDTGAEVAGLERVKQRGLAVLPVEQNLRRALEIADYAYVMESGQIVLSGPGRQLVGSPTVASAYFGRLRC